MKTVTVRAVKSFYILILFGLLGTIGRTQPLPPPDPNIQLCTWSFDDTSWYSDLGYAPVSFTNLNNPPSFDGNALQVDSTNAAWLQYNIVESDGTTNLTFNQGAIELWVLPDWNSGAGSGDWGRLIDVGAYSTNNPSSWWSLYFSPDGSNLYFSSETNGVFTNYLSCPISWDTNTWHFVALTYNRFRSQLYVDGQLATNGAGAFYLPSASVVSNGFFVGSDNTGVAQSRSLIDDMATYNYAISTYEVTNDYAAGLQIMNGGGSHSDDGGLGPPGSGGGGGTNDGGGWSGFQGQVFTTNDLWLQIIGTTNAITTNGTAYLVINTPWNVTNGIYDLFATPNLAPSAWQWVMRTAAGQTNLTATGLPGTNEFFILGTMELAGDGSGLTVAYENLVGSTFSSDGYGTPNAWYLQNGINPQTSGVATLDPDQDGLLNYQEYQFGTQPLVSEGSTIWVSTPNGTTSIP